MDNDDFDDYSENDSLLEATERQGEEVKPWDIFKIIHQKTASGSTVQSKFIDNGTKFLKFVSIVLVAVVVLGSAVIQKASLLVMTSQIKKNVTRSYCNREMDPSRNYAFSVPPIERSTWIWLLMFTYFVPELGTFVRSVRILIFKNRLFPRPMEFLSLLVTESLPAIGTSLLVFNILPELDVIKGAMLTNALCVVPAIELVALNFHMKDTNLMISSIADVIALSVQATALVAWPLLPGAKPVLWLIPISIILISFGWWENFISERSPIKFIKQLALSKQAFPNSKYFSYAIIAPIKCLLFFTTALGSFWIREGDVAFVFNRFFELFKSHAMNITEIVPTVGGSSITIDDAVSTGVTEVIYSDVSAQLFIFIACFMSAYVCYAFGKFACKIMIQGSSFAFPLGLVVPVLLTVLVIVCGYYAKDECAFHGTIPLYLFYNTPPLLHLSDFVANQYAWLWLLWLLSQIWITRHIWINRNSKLASTEQIFMRAMYDGLFVDQSIAMNRRDVPDQLMKVPVDTAEEEIDDDKITRIYACATMWHETPEEMMEFLKSIFRMDEDQATHRIVKDYLGRPVESYYEWETHIFFDDAFLRKSKDDNDPTLNSYVKDLISIIGKAAEEVHKTTVRIRPPTIYPTPYGGRLIWTLPGKTKIITHLKDKAKIRAKKRWSQVMYMYYLLGHNIIDNDEINENQVTTRSRNTYLLALDGDIDFQPEAVHLLIQYMKKKDNLGAACGRIHPVGSGFMSWYQIFEYAVGHWMQKATEHVIGCVLCSPGCFSLFRAQALMDHNVMARYTTRATEARHYVQYDQGEDRWLCTLLLQRGYRVEYSAASDAYTHCPEGFNEFYNQRRRWMPSTMANILDLLDSSEQIRKVNNDISKLYIWYQTILMIGTVIGPGTIFLMLVGAFVTVFNLSQYTALWYNVIPIMTFALACMLCKSDTQLIIAAIISALYALIMIMVLIGVAMQIHSDGILAPSSLFFFLMLGEYVVAAFVHPKELYCLKYGVIYLMTVPSMYMLLVIYSVFNMNNVSWGTREVTVVPKTADGEPKKPVKKQSIVEKVLDKTRNFILSCSNDAKHLLMINNSLNTIQTKVDYIERKMDDLERITLDPDADIPRKTGSKRKTTIIEGSRASRFSAQQRLSGMPKNSMARMNSNHSSDGLKDSDDDDDDLDSIGTPSDDLQNNSWFYDGELLRGHVTFLDKKEEIFWKELLDKYLHPIEDDKEKVAKDLKDLRDKMAMSFFALNILFVVVVFLLTIKKEILHVQWPFNPKVNFSFSAATNFNEIIMDRTYLELEPIGFVFLIFFFMLMGIQFVGMLVHRFGTFSQIMANTDIDITETSIKNLTEDELLEKDPIKVFKQLIKLKGVNGDDEKDEEVDEHVSRRKTVADLAKNKDKKQAIINDLDTAFRVRMEKIRRGEDTDVPVPRKTIAAIQRRRTTVLNIQRKSQMQPFNPDSLSSFNRPFANENEGENVNFYFDNPAFQKSETA